MQPRKTAKELVIHAMLFEIIATAICAPLFAWIMGKTLLQMGALSIMFAFIAMTVNMIYNAIFERIEHALKFKRTPRIRILHACFFEMILILIVVPLAAWWLSVTLLQAFMMEIGMIAFFLPYTYVYNLVYDRLRAKRLKRTASRHLHLASSSGPH